MSAAAAVHAAGRIGPNAIIRMAEALRQRVGEAETARLFGEAGLERYLGAMPEHMVAEAEVATLQRVVRGALAAEDARYVARDAGLRTGDYLLAHRIPRFAQHILRALPPALSSRMLLAAIRRNSWTFAGSGVFEAHAGHPVRVAIRGCPVCRDIAANEVACDYYAATFERLFRELVNGKTTVVETACEATGADACEFEIRWR